MEPAAYIDTWLGYAVLADYVDFDSPGDKDVRVSHNGQEYDMDLPDFERRYVPLYTATVEP